MPALTVSQPRRSSDIYPGTVAALMALTDPELWEPDPGETPDERRAREDARADIVADLLTEMTTGREPDCPGCCWECVA